MRKATVTYIAPAGDNKVVEMGGVTFFDGKEVEINSEDNPFFFSRATPDAPTKIEANQHFDVVMGEDQPHEKRKPGRPTKAEAEAKAAADRAAAAKLTGAQQSAQNTGYTQAAKPAVAAASAAPAYIPPPAHEA